MTEEQEAKQTKASKLKDRLRDMGVMRDENSPPPERKTPFWRSGIAIAVLLALGVWGLLWWYQGYTDRSAAEQADQAQRQSGGMMPGGMMPGGAMGPMGQMSRPAPPPGYAHSPDAAGGKHGSDGEGAVEWTPKDHWGGPMTRGQDRFGPPPGWQPATPYGPYGYYPPPPPAYYGYGPYGGPYYGPPYGYAYPYGPYRYPYPPPAGMQQRSE